jgi:hypothetical protein
MNEHDVMQMYCTVCLDVPFLEDHSPCCREERLRPSYWETVRRATQFQIDQSMEYVKSKYEFKLKLLQRSNQNQNQNGPSSFSF